MEKYGISTDVFDTYVADFHGTTVTIFEKESPNAEVNKAVCYDCHGIHDIGRTDDPHVGLLMQENLLATCKTCHPDATSNFTAAWMSHYIPSPDQYPLVYYVNLFYLILIPVTLGGMALLVVMDVSRTSLNRWRKQKQQAVAQVPGEVAQAQAVETQAIEMQAVETDEVEVPMDEPQAINAPEDDSQVGESPSSDATETPPSPSTPPNDAEALNG